MRTEIAGPNVDIMYCAHATFAGISSIIDAQSKHIQHTINRETWSEKVFSWLDRGL